MTREEAIRIFRKEIECLSHAKCEDCILEKVCDPAKTTPLDSEYIEAYGMAIQALSQEPTFDDECQKDMDEAWEQIQKKRKRIPITQKSGKWIYDETLENWRCSKCNETPKTMGYVGTADFMAEHFKFCNHCGAKMESEDKE